MRHYLYGLGAEEPDTYAGSEGATPQPVLAPPVVVAPPPTMYMRWTPEGKQISAVMRPQIFSPGTAPSAPRGPVTGTIVRGAVPASQLAREAWGKRDEAIRVARDREDEIKQLQAKLNATVAGNEKRIKENVDWAYQLAKKMSHQSGKPMRETLDYMLKRINPEVVPESEIKQMQAQLDNLKFERQMAYGVSREYEGVHTKLMDAMTRGVANVRVTSERLAFDEIHDLGRRATASMLATGDAGVRQ